MKAVVLVMMVMVIPCGFSSCVCPYYHLPMEQRPCPPPMGCRGGTVLDPCYCCMTCAKVLGETCGGVYKEKGTCDQGLFCNPQQQHQQTDGHCYVIPGQTPTASYPGYGSNPYRSTLYPSLQSSWYYNTPSRRPGENVYQGGGLYPSGQQSTTTATGYPLASTPFNYHPSTTAAMGYPLPSGSNNYHPSTTVRSDVYGVSTQPDGNNWQSFYPSGIATTTSRTRNLDT